MKSVLSVFCLLIFTWAFFLTSCQKEDLKPADLSRYFRMKSFETKVVPKQRLVQVLFQVKDYHNKGVPNLSEKDFIVTENKGRIDSEADLRVGRGYIPFQLKTVLLIDISRSVEGFVPMIKSALRGLVEAKMPEQQIAIYTFDANVKKLSGFTTDKQALLSAINAIPETNLVNSTNLYGAIKETSGLWQDVFSISGIEDGSMIIFTDGRHNATPAITLTNAKVALGGRKAYVAALASADLDEAALKAIAEVPERYFKADDLAGLAKMFTDIQQDIQRLSHSIYFLFYTSPISDPAPHANQLRIEIEGNQNTNKDGFLIEIFNSQGFGG